MIIRSGKQESIKLITTELAERVCEQFVEGLTTLADNIVRHYSHKSDLSFSRKKIKKKKIDDEPPHYCGNKPDFHFPLRSASREMIKMFHRKICNQSSCLLLLVRFSSLLFFFQLLLIHDSSSMLRFDMLPWVIKKRSPLCIAELPMSAKHFD